jgi:hypothetical protein
MTRSRICIDDANGDLTGVLEEICRVTGRSSKSDVVRDAMELYDLLVQELKAGKHIYIGKTSETAGEVLFPHLELAARRALLQVIDGGKGKKDK